MSFPPQDLHSYGCLLQMYQHMFWLFHKGWKEIQCERKETLNKGIWETFCHWGQISTAVLVVLGSLCFWPGGKMLIEGIFALFFSFGTCNFLSLALSFFFQYKNYKTKNRITVQRDYYCQLDLRSDPPGPAISSLFLTGLASPVMLCIMNAC